MSKLYRTVGVGANQQTADVTNEKIRYYKSESDLDTDLANISDDEVVFTQEGNDDRCGISLGMVIGIMSNVVPQGFLPCNGVAFDENQFPALYTLLGDNHTPYSYDKSILGDYEDITLSNNSASPTVMPYDGFLTVQMFAGVANGTIDGGVYVNDTLHRCYVYNGNQWTTTVGVPITIPVKRGDSVYVNSSTVYTSAKVRYYTHFNVIKATSGLTIEQQDYVLQSLLEADSYSTEEVATGKKWIDGKMIYRKVFYSATNWASGTVIGTISNIDMVTEIRDLCRTSTGYLQNYGADAGGTTQRTEVNPSNSNVTVYRSASFANSYPSTVIVEYTKTN